MTYVPPRIRDPESPYLTDHLRSKTRRMAPPKDLLGWFVREFRAEMPDDIHVQGVWRDYIPLTDDTGRQAVGGSLLGTPRYHDQFRRFIEDPATHALERAEYDGHEDRAPHFVFPIRAAIAALAGRGRPTDPYPFMARTLYRTALLDGDWDTACHSMGIHPPAIRGEYVRVALERLWSRYDIEPVARSIRSVA